MSRWALAAGVALALAAEVSPAVVANDSRAPDAVARGLGFVARQQRADGTFEAAGPRAAVTGLGVLAFLSAGQGPDAGAYGLPVRRAVDWLAGAVPGDGYVGRVDGSRMYGQAIVTLALAEAAGVEPDAANGRRDLTAVRRLVATTLDAQQPDGGWRPDRTGGDADAVLVGWTVVGLRAAADAGVVVPPDRLARATAYLMRCYRPDAGAFATRPGEAATTWATAMAVLAIPDGPGEAHRATAAAYVAAHPGDPAGRFAAVERWCATLAARRGDRPPADVARPVLTGQAADGGWPPGRGPDEADRAYTTVLAVLTLTAADGVLPAFR